MKDQKELGVGDFRAIPNGIGGVEHRMDLIYQGVVMGELTLPRWVELCSTTPARMFGMYPQKGSIQPGADARRPDVPDRRRPGTGRRRRAASAQGVLRNALRNQGHRRLLHVLRRHQRGGAPCFRDARRRHPVVAGDPPLASAEPSRRPRHGGQRRRAA